MRMIGSQKSTGENKWREGEYQSLIKHFEEIYKLSATSVTVLVAASGAVIAYGGVTAINGGIVCLLIILWYYAFIITIRRYTFHVLERLAQLEEETKHPGHFFGWKVRVDKDTLGAWHTGRFAWDIFVVLAFIVGPICFIAAAMGYNALPPPIEASVHARSGNVDVQLKAVLRDHELPKGLEKLLQQARNLTAAAPAVPVNPAPVPAPPSASPPGKAPNP
jgi:hypothetical protein